MFEGTRTDRAIGIFRSETEIAQDSERCRVLKAYYVHACEEIERITLSIASEVMDSRLSSIKKKAIMEILATCNPHETSLQERAYVLQRLCSLQQNSKPVDPASISKAMIAKFPEVLDLTRLLEVKKSSLEELIELTKHDDVETALTCCDLVLTENAFDPYYYSLRRRLTATPTE